MKCIEWEKISYALIFFIFGLFLIPSLGFIVGVSVSFLYIPCLMMIAMGGLFFGCKSVKVAIWSMVLFCIFVLGSIAIATSLYDYSFDGRWYHQIAMIFLKNGWNPVCQSMSSLDSLNRFLIAEIWIENYNKAFEIIGGCFYAITQRLESGKAQNLILLIGVLIYGVYTLKLYSDNWFKYIAFSFSLVCSPIVMSQIWTNYLDGFLSMLFLLTLFAILKIEKKGRRVDFVIFGASLVLLAGSKLTGVVYAGIIGVCYFAFCIFDRKNIKQVFMVGVVSFFLIIVSNINPWMTNLAKGEHIFYPLFGEKKVDIITSITTREFSQKNRIEQFLISIFSKTQNKNVDRENPTLKFPFTTDKSEEHLSVTDTRIGGFGFLFSGVIVFVVLACLLGYRNTKKEDLKIFALFAVIIVATTFINPAPWWARYVPQVWFLPLFALFFLVKKRLFVSVGIALALFNAVEAFCLSSGVAFMHSILLRVVGGNLDNKKIVVQALSDTEKSYIAKFEEMGVGIVEDDKSPQKWDDFIKDLLKQKCHIDEGKISPIKKLKRLWDCL